jgi:hypothetical protein
VAKKITRSRPWTKEEVGMLKALGREKTNDRDRAQAQAERGYGVSAGIKAGRDAGGGRKKKKG